MRSLTLIFVICFLLSCAQNSPAPVPVTADENSSRDTETLITEVENPTTDLDKGDPQIGKEYFLGDNRGRCLKCHTLGGEGKPGSWPLDDTALRRDPHWLARFLENPRNLRAEVVGMPPYRGDEKAKIRDIVAFLMTLSTPVHHPLHTDIKPSDEPEKWTGGIAGYHGEQRIKEVDPDL